MNNKFLLALLLLLSATLSYTQSSTPHHPNQVIIGFSADATQADKQLLINEMGSLLSGNINTPAGLVIGQEVLILVGSYPVVVGNITYTSELDLISTIQGQHAKVDNADFNYILTADQYSFNAFLGNNNMATFSPIPNNCEASYPGGPLEGDVPTTSTKVIKVGILDTGLDPYYSTINQYVVAEVNVLTDDEDPQADITVSYGYDPTHPIALDDNGHGTAVAGIIAGLSERAGISPANLEIYIIKCFDSQGDGAMYNMLQAIRVAQQLDLDLLNLSWGFFPAPQDEIATVLEQGLRSMGNEDHTIIVAGAGNDAVDLTTQTYFPAAIPGVANLITVAGVVGEERYCNGSLAGFSNYGSLADIAAPSSSISVPGLDGYWALNTSGTSFAAPIVTAAVIQSWIDHNGNFEEPNVTGEIHPVCNYVLKTATEVPALTNLGIEGVVNFVEACNFSGGPALQAGHLPYDRPDNSLEKTKSNTSASPLTVAPNPFSTQLMVTFDCAQNSTAQLTVSTLQGAVVVEKTMNSFGESSSVLQLPAHLPAGPYLLRVRQDGQIHTKMIVKN